VFFPHFIRYVVAKSSGRKNMWFRSARRRGTMMRCGEVQRLFQKEGFDFFQFQQLFEGTPHNRSTRQKKATKRLGEELGIMNT
ncbi:unnamed protein product, partial [Cyprideis torosa]